MIKKGVEAEAALQSALSAVDLRIHHDDGFREWGLGFDLLGKSAGFFQAAGGILDHGIEFFQIGAGDWMPEFPPFFRSDRHSLGIDPPFRGGCGLLPKADDEDKRLGATREVKLPQGISKADWAAKFRRFWIHRQTSMMLVGFRRDVPFLSVFGRTIAIEKRIAQPMFEPQPVILNLLSRTYRTEADH